MAAMMGAAIHAERKIERAASRVSPAKTATCSSAVKPLKAILLNRLRLTSVRMGKPIENGRCGGMCG